MLYWTILLAESYTDSDHEETQVETEEYQQNHSSDEFRKKQIQIQEYRHKSTQTLRNFMEQMASKNISIDRKLAYAVYTSQMDYVERYLQEGANPNVSFGGGKSLLEMAVVDHKNLDLFHTLLAHGADVETGLKGRYKNLEYAYLKHPKPKFILDGEEVYIPEQILFSYLNRIVAKPTYWEFALLDLKEKLERFASSKEINLQ